MPSTAILSIKPIYANQILAGTKTIELRKSHMRLSPGDVIFVYASAPEQQIKLRFRVMRIEISPVEEMWQEYHPQLGIQREDYDAYFGGLKMAVGLHIGEMCPISPIPLSQLQRLVPGFVPPQGLLWLREGVGKYEQLLQRLFAEQAAKRAEREAKKTREAGDDLLAGSWDFAAQSAARSRCPNCGADMSPGDECTLRGRVDGAP